MKNILVSVLIAFLILLNEFTLVYLAPDNILGEHFLNLIRFFNLINFVFILLFYFFWSNFVKIKLFAKIIIIFFLVITVDYLSQYAGYGYGHDKGDVHRQIFPYDWIRGKPNVLDHNNYGFRGDIKPDVPRESDKLVIGLFGGSTGYNGNPTILEAISEKLKIKGLDNIPINFSSVSSAHNAHLHRLVEFSQFNYDLIIFYGGGNETFQQLYYDPRPGYPYNFYMYESFSTPLFYLIKYSNILGEIDKYFKISFKLPSPRKSGNLVISNQIENPNKFNDEDFKIWAEEIKKNYFSTMLKAKKITKNVIKPNKCSKTSFLGIFQPLNIDDIKLKYLVDLIRSDLEKNDIKDLYTLKDNLKFKDLVHVDQESKIIISNKIYNYILEILEKNC